MADNMTKRWAALKQQARSDEAYLFEVDFPDAEGAAAYWNIESTVLSMVRNEVELKNLLVDLVLKCGISVSFSEYKECLKKLEKERKVKVTRVPELTPTGKACKSWDHMNKKVTIKISRGEQWQQNLL
jgi:hypothetical protein